MADLGTLQFDRTHGKWKIVWRDRTEHLLNSGDRVHLNIAGYWIQTGIEHHAQTGYYATRPGVKLESHLAAAEELPCLDPLLAKLKQAMK
jgi:Domain of unknown function (DUF5348)